MQIINGFKHGFPIHYSGPRRLIMSKNLKSARSYPNVIKQKIKKELEAGRLGGPFPFPPTPTFRVSPIGLVEKKNSQDFRLIHHLSYPEGNSVNDFIDPKLCTVNYTSFDKAVELVQQLGKGCLLGKSDIKSAFRLLPVSPNDFDQLGFFFEGEYYFDKALPFGCSISPATFEMFARFLEYAVRKRLTNTNGDLLHYLDDFLFGGSKGTNDCQLVMDHFLSCMVNLGVPIASEKTEGPKTVIVFLGLELDTEAMVVRIPIEKVKEIIRKIENVRQKPKVVLRDMQSLIGSLQFACRAIVPGRPFIRRLINSICGLTRPHHHLRVTKAMKNDLEMWLAFFQQFNGISVFHDRFWISNVDAELYSDSATGCGFGIFFAGKWAHAKWPEQWHKAGITGNISVLEFFPIFVALHLWGKHFRNKKIILHCDNMAVVCTVNSMTSKSDQMLVVLRAFTLKCLELNLVVKAKHIPGKSNDITDSLSRFQMNRFRELAPNAEEQPEPIPTDLWKIFNSKQDS